MRKFFSSFAGSPRRAAHARTLGLLARLAGAIALVLVTAACGRLASEVAPADDETAIAWSSAAIGYVDTEVGSLSDAASGRMQVRGSGADIWGVRDEFYYVYTPLVGDGAIEVQLYAFDAVHEWSKAGVMIRESLDPGSRNVLLHVSGSNGSVLQARETTGGTTNNDGGHDPSVEAGGFLRLTRSGDRIVGELSPDGTTWRELGAYTLELGEEVLIGLAVTSHTAGETARATFSKLRLGHEAPVTGPEPGPSPEPDPEPDPAPDPEPVPPTGTPGRYELPPATLFVATDGSDANSGRSESDPLRSLTRAAEIVEPGDVVYVRGGVYPIQVAFRRSGTADAPIVWASYPGEWAILDGSDRTPVESADRVWVDGVSWNAFVNFEVRNGPRQGIYVRNSSDNVFHGLVTHGNHGSGVQNVDSDRNRYEYLVTYDNFDEFNPYGQSGQDADGIGLSSGDGNVIYRVVSYDNSDDGIDAWLSTNTLIDGSISFRNGRGTHGNGNGFKAGGGGATNRTVVQRSIAFDNRASGFTQNSGRYVQFLNNTAYGNDGYAFVAYDTSTLRNNIAAAGGLSVGSGADDRYNSWNLGIDALDFVSTVATDAGFLALRDGSPAVDAGTDVGLPYTGSAPDLGALPLATVIADVFDPAWADVAAIAGDGAAALFAAAPSSR